MIAEAFGLALLILLVGGFLYLFYLVAGITWILREDVWRLVKKYGKWVLLVISLAVANNLS